jgi:hypothetical protein
VIESRGARLSYKQARARGAAVQDASSSSNVLASFKSSVSKPSVNQP